jgi:3-oxoacyl-[acyl-carrier protein] reductase
LLGDQNNLNFNLKNKTAFISGGTHGIGLACAEIFAKHGANIVSFSRDDKKILNTKKKLSKFKIKSLIENGDILDRDFPDKFSLKVLRYFKKIDILIHNVGGGGRWGNDDLFKTNNKVWEEVYEKNNRGVILFSKNFLPSMIKNNWGRVIAIGSTCGIEAKKGDRIWFNAAKSAQHAIIKSFSHKHAFTKKNITFNSISPGPILIKDTGWDYEKKKNPKKFKQFVNSYIPTKKIGVSEDVAKLCLFIASNESSYINGSNIVIDGGVTNAI